MEKNFNLYSSEGCHLCELAFEICNKVIPSNKINIIDIVDDEKLAELYGVHIPVFERISGHGDDNEKLYWPFSLEQVLQLIE
jgi:hypothetical protein